MKGRLNRKEDNSDAQHEEEEVNKIMKFQNNSVDRPLAAVSVYIVWILVSILALFQLTEWTGWGAPSPTPSFLLFTTLADKSQNVSKNKKNFSFTSVQRSFFLSLLITVLTVVGNKLKEQQNIQMHPW